MEPDLASVSGEGASPLQPAQQLISALARGCHSSWYHLWFLSHEWLCSNPGVCPLQWPCHITRSTAAVQGLLS